MSSLPGVVQHTVDSLAAEVKRLAGLGVPGVILFPLPRPEDKDATGSAAPRPDGITRRAIAAVRDAVGDDMVVMADCCLDEFTDHGHCGVVDPVTGDVDNDATLELYAELAVVQADGRRRRDRPQRDDGRAGGAIRAALDAAGHPGTAVLAYAAKYASALYGPFREAADVTIAGGGDRKGYQQDPRNRREALAEVALDVAEGADMVMVKPALTYLDVVADVRAAGRRAGGRLSRERRVRHGQGGRRAGLDRRPGRRPRAADRGQAGRRRLRPDLLRRRAGRGRSVAEPTDGVVRGAVRAGPGG